MEIRDMIPYLFGAVMLLLSFVIFVATVVFLAVGCGDVSVHANDRRRMR